MDCRGWLLSVGVLVVVGGCSFDSTGMKDSGNDLAEGSTTGGTDDDGSQSTTGGNSASATMTGQTDPSTSTNPSGPSTTQTDSDPSDATQTDSNPTADTETDTEDPSEGGGAALVLSDDVFGELEYQTEASVQLTLSNTGDSSATGVSITTQGPANISNDCDTMLSAGDMCTITVTFDAGTLGPDRPAAILTIDHDEAGEPITRSLNATVVGTTANLVPDSGFENCDGTNLPTGWEGPYRCSGNFSINNVEPQAGEQLFRPTFLNGVGNPTAVWTLDNLSEFEDAIQTGDARLNFALHVRSLQWLGGNTYDNAFIIRLYAQDVGNPLFDSEALGTDGWAYYASTQQDIPVLTAPEDTSRIRLEFVCVFDVNSEDQCNAYFDNVEVTLTYDP